MGAPKAAPKVGAPVAKGTSQATLGGTTVVLNPVAELVTTKGGPAVRVRGKSNREIFSAYSWVFDDYFGQTTLTGSHTFEISLHLGYEANSMLSGSPLFVFLELEKPQSPPLHMRLELAPVLRSLPGPSPLVFAQTVRPIYVANDVENLRYRATATSPAAVSEVVPLGFPATLTPLTKISAGSWVADHTFDALSSAVLSKEGALTYQPISTTSVFSPRSVRWAVRVKSIELSYGDPESLWVQQSCDPKVLDCLSKLPASVQDFAACGDYRPVQRCVSGLQCVLSPLQTAVEPLANVSFGSTLSDYNAGCGAWGTWCNISSVEAFAMAPCPIKPQLPDVAMLAIENSPPFEFSQGWGPLELPQGASILTREQLETSALFSMDYSSAGPELLATLDTLAGNSTSTMGWQWTEEVPCPNCTEFWTYTVVYYPSAALFFVITGSAGYDS
jgi:hypothetical protein